MFGIGKAKTQPLNRLSHEELMNLARKVVQRYVNRGSVPRREEEDMTMTVIEKFLTKENTIYSTFNGQSQLKTYCIAILNRMTCEVIRKEMKHWQINNNEQESKENAIILSQADRLMIKDEIRHLDQLLTIYETEKPKIRLFFAFYYKLLIHEDHIKAYDKDFLEHSLDQLFYSENELSKGEIFSILSKIVELAENKIQQPDAIRMWLNKIRTTTINRLNFGANNSNYDKDSFQALFEYYHHESIEAPKQTAFTTHENKPTMKIIG